ncbi:ROK family transcriptional regulator [Vallitalea sediminicola]
MVAINNKSIDGNRKILLNYIRENEPVSRTDACNNTSLSKPTVSRIVDELVKSDILIETGEAGTDNTTVGRKPVLLKVNEEAFYCIGLDITRTCIKGAILDINRNIIARKEESLRYIKEEKEFLGNVEKIIETLISQSGLSEDKILGIGIGVPCTVDYNTGILIDFNINRQPKKINLKKYLEGIFSLPVYIDNNANICVLDEYWYGYGKGYKNIIYIICNHGVGSGIIVEGNILRGKNSVAGEIGHQKIEQNGRICTCGKKGCLEAYCGTEAVETTVKDELNKGSKSIITDYVEEDCNQITFELINKCASNNDYLCSCVLDKAEKALGLGISNLINILNPDIIILSGEFFRYRDNVTDRIKMYAKEQLFNLVGDDTVFVHREDADILSGVSAATLVYKDIF